MALLLRSTVMSMSVCRSVCLSVFTIFVHVAYVSGLVLFQHVYYRPHRLSPGRGFLPHWNRITGRERGMKVHSAGEVCYLRLPCFISFCRP